MHLGFSVGAGEPVDIPLRHLCVTGQTQEAGKTTTLEALLARSGVTAVAFITKRGERTFTGAGISTLAPFFTEQADWKFVSELIDLTMGGKNKILHSFLMKVCRNTRTLQQVLHNVEEARAASKRGFDESIYQQIHGYLQLVVPQLRQLPPPGRIRLLPGVNVMDLSSFSTELQALCIRSVIDWVHAEAKNTVVVIPEAWEFLPEGRGTPVKPAAERLIRKGAALGNYLWIDSQDLGGVWKTVVRACAVFLVGVQREANEIKRTLANIPVSKPKASEVATLGLGEFYACWGKHAIKTYVQPVWLSEAVARKTAQGTMTATLNAAIEDIKHPAPGVTLVSHGWVEKDVDEKEAAALRKEAGELRFANENLLQIVDDLQEQIRTMVAGRLTTPHKPEPAVAPPVGAFDMVGLIQAIKNELRKDPVLLKIALSEPRIEIEVSYTTVTEDGKSSLGLAARLVKEGFLDSVGTATKVWNEMKRYGFKGASARAYEACDKLVKMGFLTKESDGYRVVPSMKKNIKAA